LYFCIFLLFVNFQSSNTVVYKLILY